MISQPIESILDFQIYSRKYAIGTRYMFGDSIGFIPGPITTIYSIAFQIKKRGLCTIIHVFSLIIELETYSRSPR